MIDDEFAWLEDVTGDEALAWVRERGDAAMAELDGADFERTKAEALAILDDQRKLPALQQRGGYWYNFWRDGDNPRGLWRRATRESFLAGDPDWDVIIDLDRLNADEGQDWTWHGASVLRPAAGEPWRHALIELSHGGSDADVTREFDLETRRFVPASEGGFERPESKGGMGWIDRDTVFCHVDLGPDTVTSSGYPRQVRRWRRGTPIEQAEVVFEVDPAEVLVEAHHDHTPGFERDVLTRMIEFFDAETYVGTDAGWTKVEVPSDCEVSIVRDQLLLRPRTELTIGQDTFAAGSLVAAGLEDFLAGQGRASALFSPTPASSLYGLATTRTAVVAVIIDDVKCRLEAYVPDGFGDWTTTPLFPDLTGTLGVAGVDRVDSDELWLTQTDFLTPTRLLLADLEGLGVGQVLEAPTVVASEPAFFDTTGLAVEQRFATSADGTKIPYFVVGPAERGPADQTPVRMTGYGGFEVSYTPAYNPILGKTWLERGGTFVQANIRGGGEYGPAWHTGVLKANRYKCYEDFSAVARDLVEAGITTVERLGASGGSNGGLLMGNMLTQYPECFGAIVIQQPLLDMYRYSHLLAGASWMAEYGDPDTDDWQFIREFSPYHLLRAGVRYPPVLLTSSTKDDRVHPGHARKFMARLETLGADARYWENVEGGHAGAADNAQVAHMAAVVTTFLARTIGEGALRS